MDIQANLAVHISQEKDGAVVAHAPTINVSLSGASEGMVRKEFEDNARTLLAELINAQPGTEFWQKFEAFLAGYGCVFKGEKGPITFNWEEKKSPQPIQSTRGTSGPTRQLELQMSQQIGSIQLKQ